MRIELTGKTALVTGGSGGLGRTIVKRLASCGADVAIHYHSDEKSALSVRDEIREKYGVKSEIFQADITDWESVKKLRMEIEESELSMPELLVPNAVIQYEFKPLLETEDEHFYSQFESCVMQTVHLSREFIPYMKEKRYGRIVVINTECSYLCEPTFSAYVAGKRGLDGVVRVLAKEVGEYGITVNQVAPGWTITDKERETGVNPAPEYVQTVPLKRRGTDEDIANMVVLFLSEYTSFTTGAYIPVTGGRVMPGI